VRRRLRSPIGRIVVATLTATVAALLFVGRAQAEAGDGIRATGANVDKVGWWHSKNVATSTPAANVTVPPPPGVPAGTLAVGAQNGEPDRLTAIGIVPDATAGDTVTSFTLTIKEAGPPATGFNGTAAKIVACPITSFWVGGENGTWDTRPAYDCTLASAAGTRADDGTWTFDLLAIGQTWLDPAGTVAPDGIVLVEDVASPDSFQTVFATSGDGALVVDLQYQPAATGDGTSGDGGSLDGGTSDGSFDSGSGSGSFDVPSFGSGDIPVGGLPAPGVVTPEPGATPQADGPATARPIAHQSPNVLGNLPGGVAVLVPAFILLLGLLSYSLGPAGEPVAVTRQRGVSRALAARARAGHSSSSTPVETS
jgi:hypothetical protein